MSPTKVGGYSLDMYWFIGHGGMGHVFEQRVPSRTLAAFIHPCERRGVGETGLAGKQVILGAMGWLPVTEPEYEAHYWEIRVPVPSPFGRDPDCPSWLIQSRALVSYEWRTDVMCRPKLFVELEEYWRRHLYEWERQAFFMFHMIREVLRNGEQWVLRLGKPWDKPALQQKAEIVRRGYPSLKECCGAWLVGRNLDFPRERDATWLPVEKKAVQK